MYEPYVGRSRGAALLPRRFPAISASTAAFAICAVLLSTILGTAVGASLGPLLLTGLVGLAAATATLLRPLGAAVVWLGAVLADGPSITHISPFHFGVPIYVTEVLLILILGGIVMDVGVTRRVPRVPRNVGLALVLLGVPAVLSVALRTDVANLGWLRNSALIYYALFAVIASLCMPSVSFYRRLFIVVAVGSSIALVIVLLSYGHAGGITDTGAVRRGGIAFATALGLMPIAIIAAVREGVLRRGWLIATLPFLFALIGVNHRSAWIAFAVALWAVLYRARGWKLFVGAVAVLAVVVTALFFSTHIAVRSEIARASSISNTNDPNAQFRVKFAESLLRKSITSPLFGDGFDDYPLDLVPTRNSGGARLDPHDSFVAMTYRIGLLPALLLLGLIIRLAIRSTSTAASDASPTERAALYALASALIYLTITSATNVLLEGPYGAVPFWMCFGLLAALEQQMRTHRHINS